MGEALNTPGEELLAEIRKLRQDVDVLQRLPSGLKSIGPDLLADRSLLPIKHPIARGTELPASPVDGEEFTFVVDATAGVMWTFKYNAGSASAHKWEFVGGPPRYQLIQTLENRAPNTYGNLTTSGPSFVVPTGLSGDYVLAYGARCWATDLGGQPLGSISPDNGTTTPLDTDAFQNQAGLSGGEANIATVMMTRTFNLAAGNTALLQYKNVAGAGVSNFSRRWLTVIPIRVG